MNRLMNRLMNRRNVIATAALVVGMSLLTGCATAPKPAAPNSAGPKSAASSSAGPTTQLPASSTAAAPLAPLPSGPSDATAPAPAAAATTSRPVSLTVPAIGVTTALQPLTLLPNGALQAPAQWQVAGWYANGVRPGDPGPAVIAGHVDSVNGPAIFYKLRQLKPGDTARVTRADGSTVTFVVDSVQQFPKDAFPTEAVYGPTALPVLRLVTCTGDFDYRAKSYLDNLVVSAHLATP